MKLEGLFGTASKFLSKADNYVDMGKEFLNKTQETIKPSNNLTKKSSVTTPEDEPIGIEHDINVHTDDKTSKMLIIVVSIIAVVILLKGKLKF